MLAEMVAAGDLPPLEERLPEAGDEMVVTPVDGIGNIGRQESLLITEKLGNCRELQSYCLRFLRIK